MVRTLALCLGTLLALAPAADAATVSGELVHCTGGSECRYFTVPRLGVVFAAAPGEVNRLEVHAEPPGVRIQDAGATVAAGDYCTSLTEHEARCGPRPDEPTSGLGLGVRTGDGADVAFLDFGSALLGPGDDTGRGSGAIQGGPGNDDIRAVPGELVYYLGLFSGGAGKDVLVGSQHPDALDGGRGPDLLAGGGAGDLLEGGRGDDEIAGGAGGDEIAAGRGADEVRAGAGNDRISVGDFQPDVVRCGPGRDRVDVDVLDVVHRCERFTFSVYG
jgi:RTX calcium-binding nonapeptide repeat (4 copies)